MKECVMPADLVQADLPEGVTINSSFVMSDMDLSILTRQYGAFKAIKMINTISRNMPFLIGQETGDSTPIKSWSLVREKDEVRVYFVRFDHD